MLITKNENNENEYYYIQCTGCQCNENHMLRGIYVVYLSNSYFMRASCSKWTFFNFFKQFYNRPQLLRRNMVRYKLIKMIKIESI